MDTRRRGLTRWLIAIFGLSRYTPVMQRLNDIDANFILLESRTTHQAIAAYCPCDRTPIFAEVLQRFREVVLPQFPRLQQRLQNATADEPPPAGSTLEWEDDPEFSLERHVQFRVDPRIGSARELSDEAAAVFGEHLPLNRPLWRFVVFTNRAANIIPENVTEAEAPEFAAVLLMVHHAMADGLGGMEILHHLCGGMGPAAAPATTSAPLPQPGRARRRASLTQALLQALRPAARSAVTGTNSAERSFAQVELPLAELKRIRSGADVSLNAALLTLIGDGIRRFHLHRNRAPVDLCVIVPFNLRAAIDRYALGNQITGIGLRLPTRLADPMEQLRRAGARIEAIRAQGAFGAVHLIARLNAWLPVPCRRLLNRFMAARTHCICTNMPGPRRPLKLGGATLLGEYGCAALLRGHGLGFAFVTYGRSVCISIVSDRRIVPDPWEIARCISESYEALRACASRSTSS